MQDSSRDFRDLPLSKASTFLRACTDSPNRSIPNRDRRLHHTRGLFPGPNEPVPLFEQRRQAAQPLSENTPSLAHFHALFGDTPDWVSIHTSKKGLLPWEAATTWIYSEANAPRSVSIQLKSPIPPNGYTFDEILSHELVHATRVAFDEPRFEEILAFQTSHKRWRRYLGPLFSKPRDVLILGSSLLIVWGLYLTELLCDRNLYADQAIVLPLLVLTSLSVRLIHSQSLFSRARQSAETLVGTKRALGLLLRLSDQEIVTLAKATSSDELQTIWTSWNGT